MGQVEHRHELARGSRAASSAARTSAPSASGARWSHSPGPAPTSSRSSLPRRARTAGRRGERSVGVGLDLQLRHRGDVGQGQAGVRAPGRHLQPSRTTTGSAGRIGLRATALPTEAHPVRVEVGVVGHHAGADVAAVGEMDDHGRARLRQVRRHEPEADRALERRRPPARGDAPRDAAPLDDLARLRRHDRPVDRLEADEALVVTPLGKLDLRGPDVPKLLNLLYVNKWSKLELGGVRYGVMCAEDGVVLDDGVTGHLGPDHYFMSTTSSGASTVWEWIENWLQTEHPEWQVHVVPVVSDYASMNVAGPRSRELMSRVVEGIDLTPEAFPYMTARRGRVAGIDGCLMWRIGFTGELSYELHAPAAYGLHVWEALFEAGADLGIGPFGVEAQRIMRLEKGHFIVSQDTDGLTQAFGADLGWLVKLDKEDFAGKPELVWQAQRGDYQRLVGLQPVDGSVVPPEASQIVEGRRIAGRITSSRWSPTLERSICLGFVAPHLAEAGTTVIVHLPDGRDVPTRVMAHHAHFDPDGVRLRG